MRFEEDELELLNKAQDLIPLIYNQCHQVDKEKDNIWFYEQPIFYDQTTEEFQVIGKTKVSVIMDPPTAYIIMNKNENESDP